MKQIPDGIYIYIFERYKYLDANKPIRKKL